MNKDWSMVQFSDRSDCGENIQDGQWRSELVDGRDIQLRPNIGPSRFLFARSIKALRPGSGRWAIHTDAVSLNQLAKGPMDESWREHE